MAWERETVETPFARMPVDPNADQWGGGTFNDDFLSVLLTPVQVTLAFGEATRIEENECIVDRSASSTTAFDYEMSILRAPADKTIEFSLSDSSVAELVGNTIKHKANGTCVFTAKLRGKNETRKIQRNLLFQETNLTAVDTHVAFKSGSLSKHMHDAVTSRIAGKTPASARDLFSSFPSNSTFLSDVSNPYANYLAVHGLPPAPYPGHLETRGGVDEFIRNENFWAADIDFSCCGFIRNEAGNWRRSPHITMISPIHYITSGHYAAANYGTHAGFVTANNALVVRTLAKNREKYFYGNTRQGRLPIEIIGILTEPVDSAGIVPAKMMVSDFSTKSKGTSYNPRRRLHDSQGLDAVFPLANTPAIHVCQQKHGQIFLTLEHQVREYSGLGGANAESPYFDWVDGPEVNRYEYCTGVEYLDSGSPTFYLINDELVLCGLENILGGYAVAEIQSTMNELSDQHSLPRYNLEFPDLSAFNNY